MVRIRDRQITQIVRDFMEAYALSAQIGHRLRAGDLEFSWVERLVGESEQSALFRLKEECHALFRFDARGVEDEGLHAEELFDLAVGALFHEGMKFREGYYLTTTYGPKLDRMIQDSSASGPLAAAFRRVFEAGRTRMLESELEAAELFDETRDQLLVVLRNMSGSGPVARTLLEDPVRTEQVFGIDVAALLEGIFGSAGAGYRLAAESLLESGHFDEAGRLMERDDAQAVEPEFCEMGRPHANGMHAYYAGDSALAVDRLAEWIDAGARGPGDWRGASRHVLESIVELKEETDPELAQRARDLARQLRRGYPS